MQITSLNRLAVLGVRIDGAFLPRLRNAAALTLRPACPADAAAMQSLVDGLCPTSRRLRFHGELAACSAALAARLVADDDRRQVVWLAWLPSRTPGGSETLVGEARFVIDADDCRRAELAIVVADAQLGRGIADALLRRLVWSARRSGIRLLCGEVLAHNLRMRAFMARHGFAVDPLDAPAACLRMVRELAPAIGWLGVLRSRMLSRGSRRPTGTRV